ncbi:hypothetical protein MYCTH_2307076 [Thermothelomyces thermophilus ATCC 42464]|uniref:Uncharacterized protein n=1 Tax=Thermothelomyces thermophilus (strain ATCC 42464 / BCRC 31852 / DSM 1799) TaxID=573729 RepID=G2QF71_THET4|nr:uncharacterized protein MYCTH_2307076 [Thermothelomyces thermophilus ATCC 42464]AEO59100.1 hypothetical protein MYCTH_2307076 [Thermothelomyces thermophilus ATCC 42464]
MPDLNSIPPSPRTPAAPPHRSSSQQTSAPPAPGFSSLNVLPSNQSAVNASASSSLPSPTLLPPTSFAGPSMGDNTGVGPGPGPLRHPRPLTAADLHLQLEKEQEAVVNRLTRELSILRAAHNASVASNASSTSASASGTEPGPWGGDMAQPGLGTNHYQPIRHQRTSSSASARSLAANAGSVSAASLAGISSPAPVRPAAQPPIAIGGVSLSRQNSSASRRSRTGSPSPAPPSLSGSYPHHGHEPGSLPGYFNARVPTRSTQSGASTSSALPTPASATATTTTTAATTGGELSPGILPATSRYEETALRRAELEEYKRENEALRRRVRELERLLREAMLLKEAGGVPQQGQQQQQQPQQEQEQEQQHDQETTRQRAVSAASATRSAVGVGVPDEEVRVGESAASSAVGAGRGRARARE